MPNNVNPHRIVAYSLKGLTFSTQFRIEVKKLAGYAFKVRKLAKPPFKAKPEDKIFCPIVGREVPVDAYCHGWALRNQLCKKAESCESYLQYAERRLKDLSTKRRKIHLPPKLYAKMEERARAKGLSVDQFAISVILRNVKEVKAHA